MHRFFDLPSLNVIWRVVCGRRFDYDDDHMMQMIDHIEAFTMERYIGPIVGTSALKFIPPFRPIYKSVKNHMKIFKSYLTDIVDEGKTEHDDDDDNGGISYMSAFFKEQSNQSRTFFSDKQLIISMQACTFAFLFLVAAIIISVTKSLIFQQLKTSY